MFLGLALTRHCNLRCPHCIRDDVTEVQAIPLRTIERIVDEARELFGNVTLSLTGGEPTIHPQWNDLVDFTASRGLQYRFVTNGWHMKRLMPSLDRHPPQYVRLSLSGTNESVHDAERGKGSFRRVLIALGLLTSRGIPTGLAIVIDRRDRHQVREAADLAESLGATRIHFILPQPVPGSVARDSDLSPEEWTPVRDEVNEIAREEVRRTIVQIDYGAPMDGPETLCDTMAMQRIYVDPDAKVSLCCQLSDYGSNRADIVGDLNEESLSSIYARYTTRMAELRMISAPPEGARNGINGLPCIRCARALGKLDWVRAYPDSEWAKAVGRTGEVLAGAA
jgi:MoaA/NifB/PqqE/SkfB family radical SAM enzyme